MKGKVCMHNEVQGGTALLKTLSWTRKIAVVLVKPEEMVKFSNSFHKFSLASIKKVS